MSTETAAMGSRLRWKLWNLVTRSRRVCPANAHSALIWRTRPLREIAVDDGCRRDCAANGSCWCGNLRRDAGFPVADEDVTFADPHGGTGLDDWKF